MKDMQLPERIDVFSNTQRIRTELSKRFGDAEVSFDSLFQYSTHGFYDLPAKQALSVLETISATGERGEEYEIRDSQTGAYVQIHRGGMTYTTPEEINTLLEGL